MNKVDSLKKYIKNLDAYKISNTHFKIGSKVHSSDFIYAKRLFQNSYYTSRVAILLAIKIKEKLNDTNKSLTLVGYELYSELLLSLIKKFLTDFGYKNINHFVTKDVDGKIERVPNFIKPFDNAIIIVPIASTGSTAVKIDEYVKYFHPNINFISKHYNIILATDNNEEFSKITEQTKNQDSFIQLLVNWQNPSNCTWCFNKSDYRPLFETDKSSLTPALIFGYPLAKNNEDELSVDIDKIKFTNSLMYRKAIRNNEHFLFSTNTDILIIDNKDQILLWLNKLKNKLSIKQSDKIVIISPCHYSNSLFINYVNEYLFNSSATIIHYQTGVDYLSNFKLLNYRYLNQKGAKIFFVDDSLISGGTFFRIYDILRYTLDYDDEKKLIGTIFLSDKSTPDIHKRVNRASNNNVYSFLKVNLPVPPRIFGKKPLEHEIKRYSDLSQIVLHDVFKKIFFLKSEDLNGNQSFQAEGTLEKRLRHEKMFRATHKIYEFFASPDGKKNISFDHLLSKIEFDKNELEDRMAVMKVLSQYPFLLYMPVLEKTFKWHMEWLDNKIVEFNNSLDENKFTYNQFQEIKFLIRRSVFLRNYIILSKDFFDFISKLFVRIAEKEMRPIYKTVKIKTHTQLSNLFDTKTVEYEIVNKNLDESEDKNLCDFHLYLMRQYVEVIQRNAWCAVKLKESINQINNCFQTLQGQQFLRMLKIEMAIIGNDFYSILNEKNDWCRLYKSCDDGITRNNKIILDENNDKVLQFLNNSGMLKFNQFLVVNNALELSNQNDIKSQFLNFLWIKQFINSDQKFNISNISLTKKTDSLFFKFKGLFTESENIGAFLIVTDGQETPHLVYDKDPLDNRIIKELDTNKHDLLLNFLRGENDGQNIDKKTIIEYVKDIENKWNDIYAIDLNSLQKEFSIEYNWLLLIRISGQEPIYKKEKKDITYRTLGLVGFYSKNNLKDDFLAKQLLMLLRNDLGKFIKKHHKSDEFSALREAEIRSRYAYLAGHGRQMIQKLSRTEPNIFGEVVSTMEKLQYLFATKWVSLEGNTKVYKDNVNNELLQKVFSNTKTTKKNIDNIYNIGKEIFKSEIIENPVVLQNQLDSIIPVDFSFNFNPDILTFICFELLINAKKNRFHFIDDKCTVCGIENNNIELSFNITDGRLIIELKGTGASVPVKVISEVNEGIAAMKHEHEIAGLNLIYKILKIIDAKNKISINENKNSITPCPICGVQINTVRIELNPI